MSDFKTVCPDSATLDPYKRVNYTNGLVLGVDEFKQEQSYFLEKHLRHNRGLHGYGTICGLKVSSSVEDVTKVPRIEVAPGIAVNPKGQEIRVPQKQCALLNDWLERNKEEVRNRFGSPQMPLEIYLVLCYRECLTDEEPIPSGPCVSLEESSAPTRIADHFELKLVFDSPDHTEDEKVGELIDLLCHEIEISDEPGEFLAMEQIEDMVRSLKDTTSPPVVSPHIPMRMRPDDAKDFINAAFRVWVTEVRPSLLEAGRNCVNGPPREECVLLARIEFDIEEADSILRVSGNVTVDEEDRSYLLHTRLLQEYLSCCCTRSHDTGMITSPDMSTSPALLQIEKSIMLYPSMSKSFRENLDNLPPSLDTFQVIQIPNSLIVPNDGLVGFPLPVPVDMDFNESIRVRLLWLFTTLVSETGALDYEWLIRNRFFEAGDNLGRGGNKVSITGTIDKSLSSSLQTTRFIDLGLPLKQGDIFGSLEVGTRDRQTDIFFYLLQVEISYIANVIRR